MGDNNSNLLPNNSLLLNSQLRLLFQNLPENKLPLKDSPAMMMVMVKSTLFQLILHQPFPSNSNLFLNSNNLFLSSSSNNLFLSNNNSFRPEDPNSVPRSL